MTCVFLLFLFLCRGNIILFALCLHFLYSFHASVEFSLFHFLYFIFFCLTASAISSLHQHVSLCLHGPFDIAPMCCAVSMIIFFIFCQCSFTPRCFHSYLLYLISNHAFVFFTSLFLLEFPYMYYWLKLVMPSFCYIKLHVHYKQFMPWHTLFILNDLDITTFDLSPCCTII